MYINTKMTMKDIAGNINLPGLDDVELDQVQISKTQWTLFAKVKGNHSTLVLFKHNGSSKHFVSVQIGKISPADIIPGAKNTPLKDVEFSGLSFLYNPTKTNVAANDSNLPGFWQVRNWLVKGGTGTTIKPGLNVFGKIEAHPTGELAKLLKDVGIHDLSHQLSGGFSPKVFAKNISGTAIKNEILDHLDIKVNLPILSLPGISKVAKVRKTHLIIKGVNKGGRREIDVDVAGELDVNIKSHKVAFDFKADIKKQAGKPAEISISGHTEAGRKITIDMIHPFTLDSLQFSMNKETAGWKWQVAAKTKFRSKSLDVSYVHDPAQAHGPDGPNHLAITTKMTLAEIVGKSDLPGLDDVQVTWLQVYDKYWRMSVDVKGTFFYVNVFKPGGASKYLVAVTLGPDSISPDKFIPGTSNTPLKDVTFHGMSFVLAPAELAGRLNRNQLPRDIAYRLRPAWIPGNITLKSGLNVFGKLQVHPTGEVASLYEEGWNP